MMLKRFPEASRILNIISVSLERSNKNHQGQTMQAKTISKKREQMYGLLCLIQHVAPGMAIGGIVQKRIDQKFGDKQQRIRRGKVLRLLLLFSNFNFFFDITILIFSFLFFCLFFLILFIFSYFIFLSFYYK